MMGRILYYIFWPLIWFYIPLTRRARVVIVQNNHILVVKNWFGSGYWGLPGGGIKFGESVEDASKRELKEELNLDTGSVTVFNETPVVCKQNGLIMRYHFSQVTLENKEQELNLSNEIYEAKWMPVDNLQGVAHEVVMGLDAVIKQG